MITRLMLVGMSGSGKSTVGAMVARELGWTFVDMDDRIEQMEGRSIPQIFEQDGESAFREMEANLLRTLLQQSEVVVSTGGGATSNNSARQAIENSQGTLTTWLYADANELWKRVNAHQDATRTTARPMLEGDDPRGRMAALLESRSQFYGTADVTIPVAQRSPERIAQDLSELVRLANGNASQVTLDTGKVQSLISVGEGIPDSLHEVISSAWPKAQAVWIGVDQNVANAHADWLKALENQLSVPVHIREIPSGESSKSLATYGELLDWMLEGGAQRGDVAVAFGGGVVGDLMGFAAATVLRGIGLVQVPTTLLSMVDSSVGGKTGINHSIGKNLIGAFYQPPVVLVDSRFLRSMPEREFRSGFGEIIKHGVIQASTPDGENGFLSEVLRLNAQHLLEKNEPALSWVLKQNVALKASVVAEDEREANLRQILNFGHTIGHGIEAAGYKLLHGEAIAVGMIAASRIAAAKGDVSPEWVDQLVALVKSFGLPTDVTATRGDVLDKMRSDKKKSAGKQNWVLPKSEGGVYITNQVDADTIAAAIDSVISEP